MPKDEGNMVLAAGDVASVGPSSLVPLPPVGRSSNCSGESSCRLGASIPRRERSRTLGSTISSSGPPTGPSRSFKTVRSSSSLIFVGEGRLLRRLVICARFGQGKGFAAILHHALKQLAYPATLQTSQVR